MLLNLFIIINDVLQSAIVIFGASVVLYNLTYSLRDRVTRAFAAVVGFVVIVFMTELLVSFIHSPTIINSWLRLGWVGIACVPAALFHLSDALLVATGAVSRRRRLLIRVGYSLSFTALLLAILTDWLVGGVVLVEDAPHLRAGPLFLLFALYFWLMTAVALYNVWRARRRCLISVTRQRMSYILLAMVAAPLGVFPYTIFNSNPDMVFPLLFWVVLSAGNLLVGILFTILTVQLIYFGGMDVSPERVVRVRLYKYLARVPMTATLVLTAMVLVGRTSFFLGLPPGIAEAFAAVATVILWGYGVHTFKRPFQRVFQIDDNPDVQRILKLSERIVTTRELHDFLEGVLVATCERLRIDAGFVVVYTAETPRLEVTIGAPPPLSDLADTHEITRLVSENGYGYMAPPSSIPEAEEPRPEETAVPPPPKEETGSEPLLLWEEYWMRPLYDRDQNVLLGLLGLHARAPAPDFTAEEMVVLDRSALQVAYALEDQLLQQQVFAAVEDLLPLLSNLQQQRHAALGGSGVPELTLPTADGEEGMALDDPEFSNLVRDALSHYWGGPKLTESPLLHLQIVQEALTRNEGNATRALREILQRAIEQQKPEGTRSMTRTEWLLYNILELKFVQGQKVRDVARRLAVSESDLYRKQKIAIENVAKTIGDMERDQRGEDVENGDVIVVD